MVISSPGCSSTRRVAEDSDACRRARKDEITGLEGDRLAHEGDDLGPRRRPCWPSSTSCITWPLRIARDAGASAGRATSEAGHEAGPTGQNVSSDLPRTHCPSENWRSRAETSFAQT